MAEKNNELLETFKLTLQLWHNREDIPIPFVNKVFVNEHRMYYTILNIIEKLWEKDELKPIIVKPEGERKYYKFEAEKKKYTFVINLPSGKINYKDFKSKEEYFQDAIDGEVFIEKRGTVVILTVMTEKMQTEYPYKFDFEQHDKMFLPFPVGYSAAGLIIRDLAKFPYILIGGIPGSGKSNIIHVINVSLLLARRWECFIVTIDFKRSEYKLYMDDNGLLVTNDEDAALVLKKLNDELEKRMTIATQKKVVDLRELPPDIRPPFIVVEVDEITELQDKNSQESLNRIMRLGRAYLFCVILATQKPSAKTFRNNSFTESRDLCDARMCFRVRSPESSQMILSNSKGADLPAISCILYKINLKITKQN